MTSIHLRGTEDRCFRAEVRDSRVKLIMRFPSAHTQPINSGIASTDSTSYPSTLPLISSQNRSPIGEDNQNASPEPRVKKVRANYTQGKHVVYTSSEFSTSRCRSDSSSSVNLSSASTIDEASTPSSKSESPIPQQGQRKRKSANTSKIPIETIEPREPETEDPETLDEDVILGVVALMRFHYNDMPRERRDSLVSALKTDYLENLDKQR
ncbi:hypothetical protein H072_3270 [Dactylellina haptotyla CBS 200.50]|uniref:Uncharacterized protein n=1 Tax=Dactylellina haptotyla (strain CBS 200.50) TaxID=1284197 RepID=S8BTD1_DACHA|nr:hypothetical protein H072_3270 [Dactylellina haptotyla CBS 200.50]